MSTFNEEVELQRLKLIASQQIEINQLKEKLEAVHRDIAMAYTKLVFVQQWNTSCPDFPKVAMKATIEASNILKDLEEIL